MINEHFGRKLWISFGIVMASIAITAGAFYFFAGDLSAKATAVVAARTSLEQQSSAVANLANLKHQAPIAAQYLAAMDQLLPDQYGLVTFGQWFSDTGKQYGVSANATINQDAVIPSSGSSPGVATLSFSATGSLDNITAFLHFVSAKSSVFLVVFDSFNITGDGTSYTAVGQGTIFFR